MTGRGTHPPTEPGGLPPPPTVQGGGQPPPPHLPSLALDAPEVFSPHIQRFPSESILRLLASSPLAVIIYLHPPTPSCTGGWSEVVYFSWRAAVGGGRWVASRPTLWWVVVVVVVASHDPSHLSENARFFFSQEEYFRQTITKPYLNFPTPSHLPQGLCFFPQD